MSTLYVVATPIGNLEDITIRAISVFKESDLVYAEDTRTTKKLFEKYDIHAPLESYHARSPRRRENDILNHLQRGKTVALVSEAGTPGISDPGMRLVGRVRREAPDAGIAAIPGPSALAAALSISGLPAAEFLFLGFLPHKKGREKLFDEIAASSRTTVFYESPHRIIKTLETLAARLNPRREVFIARELTKIHEEGRLDSAAGHLDYYATNRDKVRGEFTVIVSPG